MSDPLRSDTAAAADTASVPDRNTKIEQLLLDGLDEYFAGRYDQAINIWTRALFFDRHHPRARAYIERARAALAERQRESEELLEGGVAAFDRGDAATARRLLEDAIERGAPSDEARAILGRLSRIEQGALPVSPESSASDAAPRPAVMGHTAAQSRSRAPLWFAVGALAAAAGIALTTLTQPVWWPWPSTVEGTSLGPQAPRVEPQRLAVPRRAEQAMTRARRLAASGRLHDALLALDAVRPTDPERGDADRLRAEVQQQLISLVPGSLAPSATPIQ